MPNLEKAIKFAIDIANDNSHGYNWDGDKRNGNPDYDCSSLVCTALKYGGFDIGSATYTGNMRSNLLERGWKVVSKVPKSSLKRGDILLNDANHVALHIGNGQLVQASQNEKGGTSGGKPGDQTGREIWTRDYYDYPWDCVLRWTGANSGGSSTPSAGEGTATTIQVHITGGGWLPPVNHVNDTEDGYAGSFGKPIDGMAIAGTEYRVHTAKHGWLPPVKKMDISDEDNGMAGIYGDPIDGVAIKNKTYRVHTKEHGWLPWVSKYDIKDSENGMAGVFGHAIDGLQVR